MITQPLYHNNIAAGHDAKLPLSHSHLDPQPALPKKSALPAQSAEKFFFFFFEALRLCERIDYDYEHDYEHEHEHEHEYIKSALSAQSADSSSLRGSAVILRGVAESRVPVKSWILRLRLRLCFFANPASLRLRRAEGLRRTGRAE